MKEAVGSEAVRSEALRHGMRIEWDGLALVLLFVTNQGFFDN